MIIFAISCILFVIVLFWRLSQEIFKNDARKQSFDESDIYL